MPDLDVAAIRARVDEWRRASIEGHGLYARYKDARDALFPALLDALKAAQAERDENAAHWMAECGRLVDEAAFANARAESLSVLVRELGDALEELADLDGYHGNGVGADSHEQHIFDTEHAIARGVRESPALASYRAFKESNPEFVASVRAGFEQRYGASEPGGER